MYILNPWVLDSSVRIFAYHAQVAEFSPRYHHHPPHSIEQM